MIRRLPVVEAPVYRRENGLRAHQKHFVRDAFEAHRSSPEGARFVLADMVGLGKTVQLVLAGMLMALVGDGPYWCWRRRRCSGSGRTSFATAGPTERGVDVSRLGGR